MTRGSQASARNSVMGKYPAPPPRHTFKRLDADEKARVLEKLAALEAAALFTVGWADLEVDMYRWTILARAGSVDCAEVEKMAEAFERYGIANSA